jgi:DNA-binding phage protein
MTAGRCLFMSQRAIRDIARKSSLSNEGMFRSGATTRKPEVARILRRASAFRPWGEDAKPCR